MPDARMRSLMLATLLVALSPLPVLAQTQPVGVVTTLTGQATLGPAASPLKSYSAVLDASTNIVTITV